MSLLRYLESIFVLCREESIKQGKIVRGLIIIDMSGVGLSTLSNIAFVKQVAGMGAFSGHPPDCLPTWLTDHHHQTTNRDSELPGAGGQSLHRQRALGGCERLEPSQADAPTSHTGQDLHQRRQ